MDRNLDSSGMYSNVKLILQCIQRAILYDDSLIMECGRGNFACSTLVGCFYVLCVCVRV